MMGDSADSEADVGLGALISSLSLNNRANLIEQLGHIRRNGHVYHCQWKQLKKSHPHLLDTSFDILRKFESNGLQLSGHGCWFFEQVVVSVGLTLKSSLKFGEDQMLEMILRVFLEHKTFSNCCQVLSRLCIDDPTYFKTVCDIGRF